MSCNSHIQSFNQAERTVILIDETMRKMFCNVPNVTVFHRKADAPGFEKVNVAVTLTGMPLQKITIDHGGRASGYLKIS